MINFFGYSWAIVACWAAVIFIIFSHKPVMNVPRWKLILLNTSICIVAIAIVSTLHPERGPLLRGETGGYLGMFLGNDPLPMALLGSFCILSLSALLVSRTCRAKAEEAVFASVLFGFTSAPLAVRSILSRRKWFQNTGCLVLVQPLRKLSNAMSVPSTLRYVTKRLLALTERQETPVIETSRGQMKWASDKTSLKHVNSQIPPTRISATSHADNRDPLFITKNLPWTYPSQCIVRRSDTGRTAIETFSETGNTIKNTLASHGIRVEIADIIEGPNTIHFGVSPGWVNEPKSSQERIEDDADAIQERVKVDSILARKKDLSMVLKTTDLTIHAPTPGKSLVGLEIPKPFRTPVTLGDVIQTSKFSEYQTIAGLPVALGLDTGNQPVLIDLTRAPHLLVAGESGSGKSAGINSMVCSLLMARSPDDLRLILLDPKRVELANFEGLPHLDSNVIVDANEAATALSGLIDKLFVRLESLRAEGVRNIQEYNQIPGCNMPFIVVVVDELADLILQSQHPIENSLVRIAQLGRAAGVHLVLATQRPSSDVITGLLKANMPSRIAFSMPSAVDSRVLLGKNGAEALLGKGDMLLSENGSQTFQRIQGGIVRDHEIAEIVSHWTVLSEEIARHSIKSPNLTLAAQRS